jgi:excisionase family DNA binding protein
MDTILKTLSPRERKAYAKLRAGQAKQSAVPPKQLAQAEPAPQRVHRVQHRHGSRDGEAAPDPEALAYCVKDAARLIGVSRATLYILISTGDLRTVKIRKRRLIPREALSELLAGGAA